MRNKLSRIIAVILIMISVLTICAPAFAQKNIAEGTWAKTTKVARCRSTPEIINGDNNNIVVKSVPKGTKVKILETTKKYHGWYKVEFTLKKVKYKGYIREDYLKESDPPEEPVELTKWQKEYGVPTWRDGNSDKKIQNIKSDLLSWSLKTYENPKVYPKKTIHSLHGCFDLMKTNSNYFNSYTKEAVKIFQQYYQDNYNKYFDVDGIVGDQTKKALYSLTH